MYKVAVTGSKGTVGSTLVKGLDKTKFEITEIDLPEHDVTNLDDLRSILKCKDAVVHCAWKELRFRNEEFAIEDLLMTFNVYKASKDVGVKKVIMSSSNHANRYDNTNSDGKLTVGITPIPDSPYGAAKIYMEALGRFYAAQDLQVVCARIGNLNVGDEPRPASEETPQRWLSKRDWVSLVATCLEQDIPNNFVLLNAVSRSRENAFDWSNPLGWEPQDTSVGHPNGND
jgi:uronate dehydrogenase